MAFHVPEGARVTSGALATTKAWGNNGAFLLDNPFEDDDPASKQLRCIASDGAEEDVDPHDRHLAGWEHVSVSFTHRCPTWEEMEYVCRQFWSEDDTVMQLHPPRSQWVNNYPYCLHLWRPTHKHIPTPPALLVGVQGLTAQQVRALALSKGMKVG
jgi:hypothetical protein